MKTAERVCRSHDFIAWCNVLPFLTVYIHDIVREGDHIQVYASTVFGTTDEITYHSVRLRRIKRSERYYIPLLGRLYMDDFFKGGRYTYQECYGMKSLSDVGGTKK